MPPVIGMIVPVALVMPGRAALLVGAAQGNKGRAQLAHIGAKPLEHGAYDMIAQDENPAFLDPCRKMTVAEMPGQFAQMKPVTRRDLVQILLGGGNDDEPTVVEDQRIALLQRRRLGQIDMQRAAAFQVQRLAPKVALIMSQHDAAHGLACPLPSLAEFAGA